MYYSRQMNKKVIIIIAAIAVLVFLVLTSLQQQQTPDEIAQLIESGQSLECVVNREENGVNTTGHVYIDGSRVRGTITNTSTDINYTSDFLTDGIYAYVWGKTTEGDTAIKFRVDDQNAEQDQVFDTSDRSGMECQPWTVDESTFNIPSDIEFTDISAQTDKLKQVSGDVLQDSCNACDQIEDDNSRQLCLQTLNCQ